jgi:lysylphosphatidylglycerol synthetase-like protein (DUF2156 family)
MIKDEKKGVSIDVMRYDKGRVEGCKHRCNKV